MNRKQKIIVSVTGIFIVLLILVGLTYAYFLTQITGNTNEKSISVTTANLQLLYGDGNGILTSSSKLVPNMTVSEKTFTVTNNGDSTVDSYAVTLEDLKVTYANTQGDVTAGTITNLEYPNDFKLTITCTSSIEDKNCNGYDGSMPSTNDILLKNSIEKDEVHSYALTLTYVDSGIDQSKDMNKTIEAKIDIIDTKGTVDIEGTVTNYSKGDYVQVNSEPKKSYIDKNGKYKVVGVEIDEHTVAIYNGTTKKSSTTLNVEKGESASVSNNKAKVTDDIRKITMNINSGTSTYTLNSVGNDAKVGTPAYYAQTGDLKVGDYVVYNYTPGTYTTTEVDDDNVSQSFDSSSAAAIASDKWRVLSTDNGTVQLMADIRVVPKLKMYGAKGYLNGPRVLNEMTKSLYSGEYGTARSINMDDINKKVGYNGTRWYNLNGTYRQVPDDVTTVSELLENVGQKLGFNICGSGKDTPSGEDIGNIKVDYYTFSTVDRNDVDMTVSYATITNFFAKLEPPAIYEQILWDMLVFDSGTASYNFGLASGPSGEGKPYWIANSVEDIYLTSAACDDSYIKYGVRIMDNFFVNRAHLWNAPEGAQDGNAKRSYGVVPLVTLKNDLQVEKNSNGQWIIK